MDSRRDPKLTGGSPDGEPTRPTEPALPASEGPASSPAWTRPSPTPAPISNGDGEPSAFDRPPASSAAPTEVDLEARELVALYEREAKARGNDRSAAPLFFQMGRLWELRLKSLRNAASCYQSAYRLDSAYRPNLFAARRLFAQVGNWQLVEQLIDADIRAATGAQDTAAAMHDPDLRALILEKTQLLAERLGRSDEARDLLLDLSTADPDDPAPALALEALLQAAGDLEALAAVYERLAEVVSDVPLRVYFLTAAAVLHEQQLAQPTKAADLYRLAFALDPHDPSAVSGVKAHAEREGNWGELLSALKAEAEVEPGTAGGAILYQAARVSADRLGSEEEALQLLLQARQRSPADALILGELAHAYERRGKYAELAEVLAARAQSCRNLHEAVDVRMRLGAIYEEHLDREDDALACYRVVVASEPGHPQALAALGKVYHRRGLWAELLDTYEQEVAIAADPRQRAVKVYKTAEILDEHLGRVDEAVARHNEALTLWPGYLPARNSLARLLERLGRFAELCDLLEREVKDTPDLAQRISLWSEVSRLAEERLQDADRAVRAHRAILEEAPDHLPTLRSLARLCERTERWADLIWANEREASLAVDQRQIVSLLHRNGEILEEHLRDKDAAVEVYQKMLALSPTYLPGLKALGKLYAQKGRWQELVTMYRQEAEVASNSEEAASLTFKVGALYEEKLFREEAAIASYREVLGILPGYLPALAALQRIHRNRGNWEGLIEALRAEVEARSDPQEKAPVLFQIGEIAEEGLKRQDLAADAYQEVLRLIPDHGLALRALDRLYRAGGCWRELAAIYERQLTVAPVGPSRAAPYLKLARLYAERLNEPVKAAQCFEAALQSAPDPDLAIVALKGLERLRAAPGDRARRAEVRSRLASQLRDRRLRTALELLAGEDRERSAPTGAGPAEARPRSKANDPAASDYRRALELQPDSPRASSALETALRRSGDWPRLVELLQLRLARTTGAENRSALALELAEVAHAELRDPAAALRAVDEGLRADPRSLPLLRLSRSIATARGDFARARSAALSEAEALKDGELAVQAALWAAVASRDLLRNPDQAVADFRRVLDLDPLQREGAAQLADLLTQRGDSASLIEIQDRQALALARVKDPAAADALEQVARRMAQAGQATEALERLAQGLALFPEHARARVAQAEILLAENRPGEAAEAYRRAAELSSDPAQVAEAHYQLGIILQERLEDPRRGAIHFQAAVSAQPGHVQALERLALAHEVNGNWTGADYALDLLERSTADTPTKTRALVTHARVLLEGLHAATAALAKLQNAHRLMPEEIPTLMQLCTLEQRVADWAAAAQSCERLANLTESIDPAASHSFRMRAGEIYVRELFRPADAIQSYRRALDLDPGDEAARAALADLYTSDPSRFAEAKAEHRWLLHQDAARGESYAALLRIFLAEQQNDRAYCAAAVLAFLELGTSATAPLYADLRRRLTLEVGQPLSADLYERLIQHPEGRTPLSSILRIIGDSLDKVASPTLEQVLPPRADRLKSDHALRQRCERIAVELDAGEIDVYSGKTNELLVLPSSPPILVIGPAALRGHPEGGQRFLLARLVARARDRSQLAVRGEWLADAVGAALRLVHRGAQVTVGRPDADLERKLGKLLSRKAKRQLEELQPGPWCSPADGGAAWVRSLRATPDRAGLALAGDVESALAAAASSEVAQAEPGESVSSRVRQSEALAELCSFAVSDELSQLRAALRLALA